MRRIVTLVLLFAGGALVALLPAPAEPPEPLAGLVIDPPGIGSPADSSIWYCPWGQAGTERDSYFSVASIEEATASLTFPVAIPGEPPDLASLAVLPYGAAGLNLSEIATRGDSAGFIEMDGGPSAASVTVFGDVVMGDACITNGGDEWFFAGGSTMDDDTLTLRLFNPFPEVAKVSIGAFSEIGVEALGGLRSVSVNPRSWRDVSFQEVFRQRQSLVVSVRTESGLVVPVMAYGSGTDEAFWNGTGLSPTWELPVVQTEGVAAALVLANPGLSPVEVTIDLFGESEAFPEEFDLTVPAQSPLRVDLSQLPAQALGARVTASGPVSVAVTAVGTGGTAVTTGSSTGSRAWLLPGVRTMAGVEGALWLLNTSDEPLSVTVGTLTSGEVRNSRHVVDPGRLLRLETTRTALGYLVSAPEPLMVGWTMSGDQGVAFGIGSPVELDG